MTENTSSPDKLGTHGTKKSSSLKERVFRYDDRKYIDRGQLWVLQISQAILTQGVEELNCGKVGRPFVFSNTCFAAAFLFRNATSMYRHARSCRDDCRKGKRTHVLCVKWGVRRGFIKLHIGVDAKTKKIRRGHK